MNAAIHEKPSPQPVPTPDLPPLSEWEDKEGDALLDTVLQRYYRAVLGADVDCNQAIQRAAYLADGPRQDAEKRARYVRSYTREHARRAAIHSLRTGSKRGAGNAAYRVSHPGKKGYTRSEARADVQAIVDRLEVIRLAMGERRKVSATPFTDTIFGQLGTATSKMVELRRLLTATLPTSAEGER